MKNELFTQIIALIGCVTGICSLAINFYKLLSEKPKLKLSKILPVNPITREELIAQLSIDIQLL